MAINGRKCVVEGEVTKYGNTRNGVGPYSQHTEKRSGGTEIVLQGCERVKKLGDQTSVLTLELVA